MVAICLLGGLCLWLPAEEESERWMLTPFSVHQWLQGALYLMFVADAV
jgi:hypothetical protein